MSSALSGHIIKGYNAREAQNSQITTSGAMSFHSQMHGTPLPFSYFGTQLVEDSSEKIAALQAKLKQKLGPEYISQRPGPGGGPKLTYAEGWKIINLANEIFGFNGWSSTLVSLTVDFMDCHEESKRYNVGVTAVVRVTLRDGVHHEDVGYGMLENGKSKGQALDKCKKEAVTDGLKRALRNFGNVLGNCLYDKSYTQEIVKIKVPPPKLDKSELHRRPEFEETRPNLETKPLATSTPGPSTSRQHRTMPAPQQIPTAIPPHMRYEAQNSIPNSGANGSSPDANVKASRRSNTSRNEQIQAHINAQNRPAPAQQPSPLYNAEISTLTVDTSLNDMSFVPKIETDDTEDSFGYSEDDAFLAAIDLDVDLGPPIEEETDTGCPIIHDEDLPSREDTASSGGSSRHSEGQQGAIQTPPQQPINSHLSGSSNAQVHINRPGRNPMRNQNPNLGSTNASAVHPNAKRVTSAPAGGFHFPPNMNPYSVPGRPGSSTTSSIGPEIGVKRPAEAMSAGQQRQGSGAGSHQAGGRLELGEGGHMKRMRKQ